MNYTLNQLHIFLKIYQTQSVTKAAEELRLTQPAVSIQLKNFQDQFDFPLTEVVGRKIYITDFGKEIAVATESILNQVAMIDYKALNCKGLLTGRLKISMETTGTYVMPHFLSAFMKQHEAVELTLDVTDKKGVTDSLETNAIDFSLVSTIPSLIKSEKIELVESKTYLVGNRDHKLKKGIDAKQIFKELPLIYEKQASDMQRVTQKFIERNHLSGIKRMELASNEAVKQAVIAGLGYSIMPIIGIKNELQNGELTIIPISGLPIRTCWRLIWLKGKKHSAVANKFLEYLKEGKSRIAEKKFGWCEDY